MEEYGTIFQLGIFSLSTDEKLFDSEREKKKQKTKTKTKKNKTKKNQEKTPMRFQLTAQNNCIPRDISLSRPKYLLDTTRIDVRTLDLYLH